MKTMYSLRHTAGVKACLILLALLGTFLFGAKTVEAATRLSNTDCLQACHSPEVFNSLRRHHTYAGNGCATCHYWVPQKYAKGNCIACHYIGTAVYHALDVTTAHQPFHDKTDIPSAFCSSCHVANVVDEHLTRPAVMADDGNLNCPRCHNSTDTNILDAILLGQGEEGQVVYCSDCHGFSMHALDHDMVSYTVDEEDCPDCSSCHYCVMTDGAATEHIMRGFICVTCHSSQDPAVQDAIELGRGEFGQLVICVDCHYQAQEAYDIHVEAHNVVCNTCHKLPVKPDGSLIGIHELNTSFPVDCSECHRMGYSDLDKNTIFSVQVNDAPGEPPDYDYTAAPYLSGPCLTCHPDRKLNKKNSANCYPCHIALADEGWPADENGYSGSETWGHNFKSKM